MKKTASKNNNNKLMINALYPHVSSCAVFEGSIVCECSVAFGEDKK